MLRGEIYLVGKIDKKTKKTEKGKSVLYIILAIALLIVIVAAVTGFKSYTNSFIASVGKEKVSVNEYKFFFEQEKANMLNIAGNPDPQTFWETTITGGEKAIDIAKRKTLETIRELKIQLMKAKEQKLSLDKEEIDNIDKNIGSIVTQYGSKSAANSAYKEIYGIDLDNFKKIYKDYILINKFLQKEMESVKTNEDEIEEYYNKFPDAFTDSLYRTNGQEAVWVKHILIATINLETQETLSSSKLKKAEEKAADLLERAKNKEDFVKLVEENSEDAGSVQNGGDYLFSRGSMMPEFEELSFELEPGSIDMAKTDYGYHIIKLEEKVPQGEPVSLRCAEEYWEFKTNAVRTAKYMEKMEEWKKDSNYKVVKNESVYNSIK
jgi:foldase protein PrsA